MRKGGGGSRTGQKPDQCEARDWVLQNSGQLSKEYYNELCPSQVPRVGPN